MTTPNGDGDKASRDEDHAVVVDTGDTAMSSAERHGCGRSAMMKTIATTMVTIRRIYLAFVNGGERTLEPHGHALHGVGSAR